MKTISDWEEDILRITMKIQNEFPELSKYLSEMPQNFSGNDKDVINVKNMEAYYNTLADVLDEYSKTHENTKISEDPDSFKLI